jgi:hypothetical protein
LPCYPSAVSIAVAHLVLVRPMLCCVSSSGLSPLKWIRAHRCQRSSGPEILSLSLTSAGVRHAPTAAQLFVFAESHGCILARRAMSAYRIILSTNSASVSTPSGKFSIPRRFRLIAPSVIGSPHSTTRRWRSSATPQVFRPSLSRAQRLERSHADTSNQAMEPTANRPYAQIFLLTNATRSARGGSSWSR